MNFIESFIQKASVKHNNKYGYSLVIECASKDLVEIVCPDHGIFNQRKDVHLKGTGCQLCTKPVKPKHNITEIVKILSLIHSYKYDYSLVEKSNVMSKISIICHRHGVFEQTIAHNKLSKGCPQCSYDEYTLSTDTFIKKASEVHNFKYDYSLVILNKGSKQKVEIICPIHGLFDQPAGSHMNGKGCRRCGYEKSLKSKYTEYTTERFVGLAVETHGDKYSYEYADYKSTEVKIKIVCSVHGIFEQRPLCHIRGKGCIKCRNDNTTYNFIRKYRDNQELGNKLGKLYILEVYNQEERFLKLGITSDKIGRFKKYRADFKKVGYEFRILFEYDTTNYASAMSENDIFKAMRIKGNIYVPNKNFSGKGECLIIGCLDDLVDIIPSKLNEYGNVPR